MTEDSALSRLETVVRAEREAIGKLDSAAVLQFTEEKRALLEELTRELPRGSIERLQALRRDLQHNLILLAHARDLVRDALAAAHVSVPIGLGPLARNSSSPPRLRVTG